VPPPSTFQACFYEYVNFQGPAFCLGRGGFVGNLSVHGMNNRISSAIIPAGFYVTVWEFEGYMGESLNLMGHIYDMSMYGYYWDNNISSMQFHY
jgi:hypothetical protein